jgi:hypothetical protein
MEEAVEMIRFFCDLCGRDISEKVYDSVRQFCRRDHFEQNIVPEVTANCDRKLSDMQYEVRHQREPICLEVQLLNELSKLIHASAWGVSTTAMQCSNCAMEHAEERKGKVITMFTRIAEKRMQAEIPEVTFSQKRSKL